MWLTYCERKIMKGLNLDNWTPRTYDFLFTFGFYKGKLEPGGGDGIGL